VALAAGVIRGLTGFGGAMVMAPPLALMLGPRLMVPIAVLLEGIAALPMVWNARREIRLSTIGPILAVACAAVPLGGYVLMTADPQTMRRVIAFIVIVFSLLLLRGWRHAGRPNLATSIGIGAVSGAMGGATSMSGPPVILYLLSGPDPAQTSRANLTLFVAVTSLVAAAVLWAGGALGAQAAWMALLLAPAYCGGLVAGARLFPKFGDTRLRQIALILLIAVSIGIVVA
jgi:uncharacterized membrane protein YfcA